jgi:hypothetical protein
MPLKNPVHGARVSIWFMLIRLSEPDGRRRMHCSKTDVAARDSSWHPDGSVADAPLYFRIVPHR